MAVIVVPWASVTSLPFLWSLRFGDRSRGRRRIEGQPEPDQGVEDRDRGEEGDAVGEGGQKHAGAVGVVDAGNGEHQGFADAGTAGNRTEHTDENGKAD